jgi:hypothetical protein
MNWEALSRDFSRCREAAASFQFSSYCCALRARSPEGELKPLLLAQGHVGRPACKNGLGQKRTDRVLPILRLNYALMAGPCRIVAPEVFI